MENAFDEMHIVAAMDDVEVNEEAQRRRVK